jgi:hypothetical protein
MDKFLLINAVVAGSAILIGLYSHKLTAALAAGFWLAVVHTGLILLVMGQAGAMTVPQLPMLADVLTIVGRAIDDGIKMAQPYFAVDFANTALLAYFVTTLGILLALILAAFIISSVVTTLASLLIPQKAEV